MGYPESLRDDLPKRETYPLGREQLDSALGEAGVEQLDLVYFLRHGIDDWQRSRGGLLLTVTFRAKGTYSERLELRIHAVPAELKMALGAAASDALPRVAKWIRDAGTSENVWRSSDHALTVRWIDGKLRIDED